MKAYFHKLFKIIIIVINIWIINSCKPIETEVNENEKYSISLGEFNTYDEADQFKTKTDFKLWRDLTIKQIEEKRFILIYGSFESSFDAGEKGFELLSESLVTNYKIFRLNNYVYDNYSNFMFIGKYQGRQSIYNFNLISQNVKQVWSRWGRKVITLNRTQNNQGLFFTTALGFGKQGSFPYIRDARLYIYRDTINNFEEIQEFGTGLQLYTYWENTDTFKVNFSKPDSINSNTIVQEIFSYDINGNRGYITKRTFNLIQEGFPKPPQIKPEYISPSKKKQIRVIDQDNKRYIYLRDIENKSEILVLQSDGKLSDIRWSRNSSYAIINLTDSKTLYSNELAVIDCNQKKIIKTFNSNKYINSLVHGNLLFFEEEYNYSNTIAIYNCEKDIILNRISIPGGCGIFNLK